MNDGFEDIPPPETAVGEANADEVSQGPAIPPQQRIMLYSAEEWEKFTHEWAHFCLKRDYVDVQRFSGAGDHGIDIAGFVDEHKLLGVWDNYQCKRFLDRTVYPSDAWPEIGKILWYSFRGEYKSPRKYYFVAPRGVGTALSGLLANAVKLKEALFENWEKHVRGDITKTQEVALEGAFRAYVEEFDFSIFDSKTALQMIEQHRTSPCYAARFGGGLPRRPTPEKPPPEIATRESRYVAQLLSAYADHKKKNIRDVRTLNAWPPLEAHFGRQREAFYHAESLRMFARDTVPIGTFESLQEDVFSGVVDICEGKYADGYERVKHVTQTARELHLTSNALLPRTKPKDRDGICHQLANEDRLQWTKP